MGDIRGYRIRWLIETVSKGEGVFFSRILFRGRAINLRKILNLPEIVLELLTPTNPKTLSRFWRVFFTTLLAWLLF